MALEKKSIDVVYRLHKGLGVRDGNLSKLADTGLARRWLITESDPLILVRAKVIYRLERVFGLLPSPDVDVWPVIYNAVRDLMLFDQELGVREAELPQRFPNLPVSSRSASRIGQRLRDHLLGHVTGGPAEPFDLDRLAAIRLAEDEFALTVKLHRDRRAYDRLVASSYDAPIRQAQVAFLAQEVVTPVSESGQLIVARTPLGDWVCAFRDVEALHAYQDALPQQESGSVLRLSGVELVRRVVASPHPIGVMFNPTPTPSGDVRFALPLTPVDLSYLSGRL